MLVKRMLINLNKMNDGLEKMKIVVYEDVCYENEISGGIYNVQVNFDSYIFNYKIEYGM